jgi:hypothetical protein
MTMNYDWCFQEGIDDWTRAWLTEALEAQVTEWFDVTRSELRNRLDKHGKNRTEASLYCAQLTAPGLAGNLEYLCLLACERDKAEPTECVVFVGSETYTRGKCDEYQAHVIDLTKNQPGGKALIVGDREKPGATPPSHRMSPASMDTNAIASNATPHSKRGSGLAKKAEHRGRHMNEDQVSLSS